MMKYTNEYICTTDNISETLDKYGVAIIEDVISLDECIRFRNNAWEELKELTSFLEKPIDINNPSTWKSLYELFPIHSMLIQHFGAGHMQWIWDIRQHPNVVNIFSKLWKVDKEELLTSFDGFSVHFPPEKTKRGWFRNNNWMHTDQSSFKKGRKCVQGFINLYDVNEGDATLCVFERSHKLHEKFFTDNNIEEKNDWYKVEPEDYKYFEDNNCEQKCIKCKAGSIVLWDSRTFHQGVEAFKEREKENFRLISYVCMMPRSLSTLKDLEKKRKIFNDLRMTTHWPNKPKLFPKNPRTYGKFLPKIKPINPPVLTELGKKLAGF